MQSAAASAPILVRTDQIVDSLPSVQVNDQKSDPMTSRRPSKDFSFESTSAINSNRVAHDQNNSLMDETISKNTEIRRKLMYVVSHTDQAKPSHATKVENIEKDEINKELYVAQWNESVSKSIHDIDETINGPNEIREEVKEQDFGDPLQTKFAKSYKETKSTIEELQERIKNLGVKLDQMPFPELR
jgi:hypothetical protein